MAGDSCADFIRLSGRLVDWCRGGPRFWPASGNNCGLIAGALPLSYILHAVFITGGIAELLDGVDIILYLDCQESQ